MPESPFDNIHIVLVQTSHPGNIGAVARAMKNMGLSRLTLVAPRRFPDDQARWRAANAADLLERARVVEDLPSAVADCTLVVGTSARERRIPWPALEVRDCARELAAEAVRGPVAVVFGREDRGLTNDELQSCHLHLSIPTDSDYSALNLAMAVQIVCYELRMALCAETLTGTASLQDVAMAHWDLPPAAAADVERLMGHFEQTLTEIGFLNPAAPKQLMTRLRRLILRARPDTMEVSILRGILTRVQHGEGLKRGQGDGGGHGVEDGQGHRQGE